MTGRPSEYSEEIVTILCDKIMQGMSLKTICEEEGMPGQRTVYAWLATNVNFQQRYAHAREVQADTLADEMLEVGRQSPEHNEHGVDAGEVAHRRLQIDVLKWRAAKLRPKVYGDKQEVEHTGSIDLKVDLANRLAKAQERVTMGTDDQSP